MTTYALTSNRSVIRGDGVAIPADMNNIDWQAYQAWFAAGNIPAPAPPATIATLTFLQFMALFTEAEQAAIVTSTDTQVKLFTIMAAGSGGVLLSNPEVAQGVEYLATATSATPPGPGLIAASRVAQILANQTPPSS